MNIYATIRDEWTGFMEDNVEIVDGYSFNQYDTVKRIHRYLNSQYENAQTYDGREKLFFNISKYRCIVASRMMNFDTKDIRLWPMNPDSEIATFLLEKELALWMKKAKMGKLLNQIADELPEYGSIVMRKTKKGAKLVDLRRLALDPTVESIGESRFVSVKHYLTEPELRAKIADGWDEANINALIERKRYVASAPAYENGGQVQQAKASPYYEVYERFGEVEKEFLTGKEKDSEEKARSLCVVAEPFSVSRNSEGAITSDNGLVLFKSEWKGEYPFKDAHYFKVKGRWLGVGVIEDLFAAQERRNEMANQKRVSMEISGMHLFQTPGKTSLSNVLSDLKNGDVLPTGPNGTISPLATEERNLPAYNQEEASYEKLADNLSFAYDVVRGEAMPASTPVTNALMQNQNSTSVFAYKRETLGLTLQDYFNELVLPQLVKDLTPEHILRFMGSVEDIEKLDGLVVKSIVRETAMSRLLEGKMVTREDLAKLESDVAAQLKERGATRFLKITDGYYKDAEFQFDFMVTNEQENVGGMAQNLFQLVTSLAQNPEALNNPVMKTLMYEYARKIGISPIKLEMADNKRVESQGQPENAQALAVQMSMKQPANV